MAPVLIILLLLGTACAVLGSVIPFVAASVCLWLLLLIGLYYKDKEAHDSTHLTGTTKPGR